MLICLVVLVVAKTSLGEGAALDLLAVLAALELLVVSLVLGRHESLSKLGHWALGQSNVLGKASNLASNPLHALFALDNGGVDVVDALSHVGHGVEIILSMSLPAHS